MYEQKTQKILILDANNQKGLQEKRANGIN